MRAHRMIAALLMLQTRGQATARDLAEELEVSVATVRRDLEALSSAGVPVYSEPGRGGGWRLVGGARTNLTGLTAPEARALFTALGMSSANSGERSALRKLLQAVPEPFRPEAESALSAVRRDEAAWGAAPRNRPPLVEDLQLALVGRLTVRADYRNRAGEHRKRTLSPLRLMDKDGTWYLLAIPDGYDDVRTYRVDRLSNVHILADPAKDTAEDLDEVWDQTVKHAEGERSQVSAIVAVSHLDAWVVERQFGRHCIRLEGKGPDQVLLQVAAHSTRGLAEQLAG